MNRIPAQIAWPMAVVGLILLGMTSTFGVLIASRSDGGPRVIKQYYQKAVAWDSTAAVRQASVDLGWVLDVSRSRTDGQTELEVRIVDSDGRPISGLSGEMRLSRPQSTGVLERLPLEPYPTPGTTPGATPAFTLRAFPTVSGRGLWDVEVDVRTGETRFVGTVRRDWQLP
ncbi:MAG: FixH family protein [Rhodothermales bacterium]